MKRTTYCSALERAFNKSDADGLFGQSLRLGADKGGLVSSCTAQLHKVRHACLWAATSGNQDQGDLLMGLSSSSTCLSSAILQAPGYCSGPPTLLIIRAHNVSHATVSTFI
jgi:hypothetical protein